VDKQQVKLSADLHQALKIHAARLKRPMQDVLEEIVRKYLAIVDGKVKA